MSSLRYISAISSFISIVVAFFFPQLKILAFGLSLSQAAGLCDSGLGAIGGALSSDIASACGNITIMSYLFTFVLLFSVLLFLISMFLIFAGKEENDDTDEETRKTYDFQE